MVMSKVGKDFEELVKIVARIRKECPWDKEQTFESLKPYLIEEVHEVIEAIDEKDYDHLCEELGDMLLHVVMVAIFASEDDLFNIHNVIKGISEKMVRRHPHVFLPAGRHGGPKKLKSTEEVLLQWKKIKHKERKGKKPGR